jgi:hypothetical protein
MSALIVLPAMKRFLMEPNRDGAQQGHPIIFLSSSILKKVIRRLLQPEKDYLSTASTASLPLQSNPAPKRYSYPAYLFSVAQHPLSRLQSFSERGPVKLSLYEVHLASM